MTEDTRSLGLLTLLSRGLETHNRIRSARNLGDRSRYVGMSDVAKAITCMRAAVASKLVDQNTSTNRPVLEVLRQQLVLQRGHWLEAGLEPAFRANGATLMTQLEIQVPGDLPMRAHLDFTFVAGGPRPTVRVLELKSTENLPRTLYPGYEAQIYGQVGLLSTFWNMPVFRLEGDDEGITFPELCHRQFGLSLPGEVGEVDLEGWVLCLSMSDAKVFGPYRPDETILSLCQRKAAELWNQVEAIRSGRSALDDCDLCRGFHPLCDWCEFAEDCPKFQAEPIDDPVLDQELAAYCDLKARKAALESDIAAVEENLRSFCRRAGKGRSWLQSDGYRFRTLTLAGRQSIDTERLRLSLFERLGEQEAERFMAEIMKTGREQERLTVSPIRTPRA